MGVRKQHNIIHEIQTFQGREESPPDASKLFLFCSALHNPVDDYI